MNHPIYSLPQNPGIGIINPILHLRKRRNTLTNLEADTEKGENPGFKSLPF